jgi:hypothetical protein
VIDGHLGIEDRSRIGTIALPHYSPEHGLGMIAPQAPRRKEMGVWLYGIGATFDSYYNRNRATAKSSGQCSLRLLSSTRRRATGSASVGLVRRRRP